MDSNINNITRYLSLFILSLALSSVAFAGNSSSGGGGAVVCYGAAGGIQAAELLDLYEGRTIFGNDYLPSDKNFKDILVEQDLRLQNTGYHRFGGEMPKIYDLATSIYQNAKFLSDGNRLTLTDDNKATIALPVGCVVEQAATYLDDRLVVIDGRIWRSFTNDSKAALLLHEAVYRIDRTFKKTYDSRRIRRLVATVFDRKNLVEDMVSGLPKDYIFCKTQWNTLGSHDHFSVFAVTPGTSTSPLKLQFFIVDGDVLITKTEISEFDLLTFPFLTPSKYIGDFSSYNLITESSFEGKDHLTFSANATYKDGKYSGYELSLEGYRTTYPERQIERNIFTCNTNNIQQTLWRN